MRFGIRGKVFSALAALVIVLSSYLYFIWVPATIDFSRNEALRQLHQSLEVVGNEIAENMAGKRQDSVFDQLDLILLKNPEWKSVTLQDMHGKRLYPREAEAGTNAKADGPNILTINNDFMVYGKKAGKLTLRYDFSETQGEILTMPSFFSSWRRWRWCFSRRS